MLFYRYVHGGEICLKVFFPGDDVDAWELANNFTEWERSEV